MERLRQGKGIKEVAGNICSVSTLSKIERVFKFQPKAFEKLKVYDEN